MPVTPAFPPFHSLAEVQRNRSRFVFFVEPDAPRAFQQFDGIECCRNLKGFVCEHNAFNALQLSRTELPRRIRVADSVGAEADGGWFKKIRCETMAKWLLCTQRMILDINDTSLHPCPS